MATLKDMKRILSFLFSAWLCVPIIDTFSSAINTNGLSGLEHGSMNFCHMLVQIWRDWYIWRRPCSKFSRVHRWDHRTPNFSWQNWRFSCTLRCHQWLENPSEFLKKNSMKIGNFLLEVCLRSQLPWLRFLLVLHFQPPVWDVWRNQVLC